MPLTSVGRGPTLRLDGDALGREAGFRDWESRQTKSRVALLAHQPSPLASASPHISIASGLVRVTARHTPARTGTWTAAAAAGTADASSRRPGRHLAFAGGVSLLVSTTNYKSGRA